MRLDMLDRRASFRPGPKGRVKRYLEPGHASAGPGMIAKVARDNPARPTVDDRLYSMASLRSTSIIPRVTSTTGCAQDQSFAWLAARGIGVDLMSTGGHHNLRYI